MKPHSNKQQPKQPLYPDYDFCEYRLRTARQKRRLVIEDRDKQLLAMNREWITLHQRKRALPLEPIIPPYQRGWKRSFVLREDVANGSRAAFFEQILLGINTTQHHHDRRFMQRHRRFGRKIYLPREQYLKSLDSWDWRKAELTEEAAALFELREEALPLGWGTRMVRVFTEPWRFVLRVERNMVTHRRVSDLEIERGLASLRKIIRLQPTAGQLEKLVRGNSYHYRCDPSPHEPMPKRRPFRNWPIHLLAMQDEW